MVSPLVNCNAAELDIFTSVVDGLASILLVVIVVSHASGAYIANCLLISTWPRRLHLPSCRIQQVNLDVGLQMDEALVRPSSLPLPDSQQDLEDTDLCIICMDCPSTVVFEPCQHVLTCISCCEKVMAKDALCPLCRSSVATVNKV